MKVRYTGASVCECRNMKMSEQQFEPACRRMEWLDPFYKQVWERAFADAIPISGTFELTPRCNFNCRMCYVHLSESEISQHGREMSTDEWIRIAQESKEAGTTWLCITGGEPLMHPEFETIWTELAQMGFFITLQTNASLVTKYEKLFEKYPPRACKITLYGSNNNVYRKVCQVERGFTRVDEGIQMLRQMKIPVELVSTIIQQNLDDVENIISYVAVNKLRWNLNINVRTAGRGVDVDVEHLRIKSSRQCDPNDMNVDNKHTARVDLNLKPCTYCKDYRLGYWIVWNGYMRFCSFMSGPNISVRDNSVAKCWKELLLFQESLDWPEECKECEYQKSCERCAALFDIENGKLKQKETLCRKKEEKNNECFKRRI